ncbi:MAG TPA: methyltransferase domain-containing protein [Jatrophihabitans sp.]|jgi:ubiquinone/menaquinone biosynthesis C-methylase UbiE
MSSRYVYDQAWAEERARLAGLESLWDPGTRAVLTQARALEGARVLEAGAGGGSVVEWLAMQVGDQGRVVAADLDVRFVEPMRSEVVEVAHLDLVADVVPQAEFDVVHSRLVLEHLADRDAVLAKLVKALRPGGTLVIEDYDWTAFGIESADGAEQRGAEGILRFMGAAGFDQTYGRKLVGAFITQGLENVTGSGRSYVIDASHPGYAFFRLSFEQIAPQAVQAGFMQEPDATLVGERLRDGEVRVITPTLIAATGTRPV